MWVVQLPMIWHNSPKFLVEFILGNTGMPLVVLFLILVYLFMAAINMVAAINARGASVDTAGT